VATVTIKKKRNKEDEDQIWMKFTNFMDESIKVMNGWLD